MQLLGREHFAAAHVFIDITHGHIGIIVLFLGFNIESVTGEGKSNQTEESRT